MLYQNKMADQNTMVLSQKPLPSVDSQKAFLRFLYCGKINLCAQSAMVSALVLFLYVFDNLRMCN